MGISTYTKKQKFLAGVVCSLIVLAWLDPILRLLYLSNQLRLHAELVPGSVSGLPYALVGLLGAAMSTLVLLKFLLPNWRPHQKWLGWLLGVQMVSIPFMAIAVFLPIRGLMQNLPLGADMGLPMLIIICVAAPVGILISPELHLLRGIVRKKSTERIAGVLSVVALVSAVLSMLISIVSAAVTARSNAMFAEITNTPIEPAGSLFNWSRLPDIIIQIGYIILFFNWPVLSRPILEKENTFMEITFEKTPAPKQKPADQSALGFGVYFTDHMFLMTYDEGEGWHSPRIVPYGPIALDPAAMCLHYGQEVFEGLKAYYGIDGKVRLFRPEENMARLNLSNERLCIPPIDEAFAVHAVEELVKIEKGWIPTQDGTSLYIRPYIFATDPHIGVRPAKQYIFAVILSPVGAYYASGLNPVKIFVEEKYVRAVKGGMGFTKAAANYASSLKAQEDAHKLGYSQVLWLDGVERRYIEEVGTMNVFFVIDDEIVTPALQGSILGGITRKSCIEILRAWGCTVNERPLSLEEVVQAAKAGHLKEAFGSGTAAVVSPIGELACGGEALSVNNGEIGAISQRLYDELTGIQWGKAADPYGWTKVIA